MKIKLFTIANILTLINAFFGCVALVFLFAGNFQIAFYCTMLSLLADFLDGFAARKFGSSSDLGKQLDSLADMISFGLVPGLAVFMLLNGNGGLQVDELFTRYGLMFDLIKFSAFFITLFSLLRLAKFNIDTRQQDSFIGLATPANTLFWVGYLSLHLTNNNPYTGNIFVVLILIALSCFFLIAEIPMFSFKFKNFSFSENKMRYAFLLASLILLICFHFRAFVLIIPAYILISIALLLFKENKLEAK